MAAALTRKRLVLTGAATAGAVATAGVAAGCGSSGSTRRADVIVAGAGLSGLAAALKLKQAGRSVLVLEARDRQAIYETPFWRDDDLSGEFITDVDPLSFGLDNSPPDGKPGVLVGFFGAQASRDWAARPVSARKAAMVAAMTRMFGAQAGNPIGYVEGVWPNEEYSRGCWGYTPRGILTGFRDALTQPVGHIHWAGTETQLGPFSGFMDGAIRTGERAAAEILG